ncbi:MAG: O-antigen ligase family protein, partial [Actinobacteria bacterium]|nr:O-antigen ligase family protein [Actinomycetota bacterium]
MSDRLPGRRLPELVDDRAPDDRAPDDRLPVDQTPDDPLPDAPGRAGRVPAGRGPGRPIAAAPAGRLPGAEVVTWLLLAALATAVLDQGGFHATAQRVLGLALAAAAGTAWLTGRRTTRTAAAGRRNAWTAPAGTGFACAGWAFFDGWLHGSPASGVRPALLVAAAGAVIWCCRQLPPALRAQLLAGVLWLGCLAALLGWYGVAGHVPAFALTGQGVWRAMGTLGYPNAAAALLAMAAVAAIAGEVRRTTRQPGRRWPDALVSTALLTGLGATFSRGGLLAAVAGFVALAVLLGPRRVLAAGSAPVLGATVAVAGLLPGLATTAPPKLAVAAGALAAGLAAGIWLPAVPELLRSRIARSVQAFAVLLTAGGVLLAAALLAAGRSDLHARFALSSTDRTAAWRAGAGVVRRHPVLGIGPGPHTFTWPAP